MGVGGDRAERERDCICENIDKIEEYMARQKLGTKCVMETEDTILTCF